MTPKQWISDGGYSADVPEVPASLRHFYNPTRPAWDRFLTDITKARIMGSLKKYVFTNASFVTSETISGTDRYGNPKRQATHPEYPYAAPILQNLTYNENDCSYNSGSGVKQCVDH